jgi:hypothetical protein
MDEYYLDEPVIVPAGGVILQRERGDGTMEVGIYGPDLRLIKVVRARPRVFPPAVASLTSLSTPVEGLTEDRQDRDR